MSIYFTNMEDLIKKLRKDQEAGRICKGWSYYNSSLVIMDEVGYTPINREECNLFFRFIANRFGGGIKQQGASRVSGWPDERMRMF